MTASPDDLLENVVENMRSRSLGCAIVTNPEGIPLGMFTESMLIHRLVQGQSCGDVPIKDCMQEDWPAVCENDPVVAVLNLMKTQNVRFIVVVNDTGQLVGLTGHKGLLEYIADHFPEQVMVQRIGGTPHLQNREGA